MVQFTIRRKKTDLCTYGIVKIAPLVYEITQRSYSWSEIRDKQPIVLDANIINLKAEEDQQSKLKEIFLQIQEIIEAYSTGILAIEAPFYGKNPQSMLKLGRAQGVSIAAAMVMGLDIQEFSPKKIKKSINRFF